ncbi:MAG: hypothetical protein V5A20_12300 [Salinibacter sp.]|jgi:hypothetical protein|uniref:hypothetical protein n=1 Tax=Salinibacter sp. TaxID=2065818 RepID=UPI002FC36D4B
MTQKALIVRTGPDGHEGLKKLNVHLEQGWRVATVSPMGGAGEADGAPCHAALVVLDRRDAEGTTVAVEAVERAESEAKSVVEEVMRGIGKVTGGDGAGRDEATGA